MGTLYFQHCWGLPTCPVLVCSTWAGLAQSPETSVGLGHVMNWVVDGAGDRLSVQHIRYGCLTAVSRSMMFYDSRACFCVGACMFERSGICLRRVVDEKCEIGSTIIASSLDVNKYCLSRRKCFYDDSWSRSNVPHVVTGCARPLVHAPFVHRSTIMDSSERIYE